MTVCVVDPRIPPFLRRARRDNNPAVQEVVMSRRTRRCSSTRIMHICTRFRTKISTMCKNNGFSFQESTTTPRQSILMVQVQVAFTTIIHSMFESRTPLHPRWDASLPATDPLPNTTIPMAARLIK